MPSGLIRGGREREDTTAMNSVSAGAVLQAKYAAFTQRQTHVHDASIETIGDNTNTHSTSIELPAEIKVLVTGTDYWVLAKTNRYKKLIREGHLDKLLHLARLAQTKEHPANWFATACSVVRWEEHTLPYLAKLRDVARKAQEVARRLSTTVNRFIYQQIWKGVNVERWAIQAEEVRHDKPGQSKLKHFAWLCIHEKTIRTEGGAS